jgi:hypothetical protein
VSKRKERKKKKSMGKTTVGKLEGTIEMDKKERSKGKKPRHMESQSALCLHI